MRSKTAFFESSSAYISVVLILLVTGGLWINDINQKTEYLNLRTESASHEIIQSIHIEMEDRLETLELFHDIWLKTENISHLNDYSRFLNLVPDFFFLDPGFLAINWVDPNATIRWIFPYEANINALNQSIRYFIGGELNDAFAYAETELMIGITGLVNLFQGGFGVVTYDPLVYNGSITGYFNGVFDFNILFAELFESNESIPGIADYSLQIYNNQTKIYGINENFTENDNFAIAQDFDLLGINLVLLIRPNLEFRDQVTYWNNLEIMIIGGSLSVIIGFLIVLIQKNIKIIRRSSKEKEKLMEALSVKQKMTSLGILAGGIAHDFNNLLAGIQGNASLLELNLEEMRQENSLSKDLKDSENESMSDLNEREFSTSIIEESREYVSNINNLIIRSEKLNKQILSFSRSKDVKFEIIEVNQLIEDTIHSFKDLVDKRIKIQSQKDFSSLFVLGDPSYFSQILINILINARDAIEGLGTISIHAQKCAHELPKKSFRKLERQLQINYNNAVTLSETEDICITIKDTGIGIPSEIQDHIYDPFFTTKKSEGKGSGLGLTIVYNYVTNMGGSISFESEIGFGTSFNLTFPSLNFKNHINYTNESITIEESLNTFDFSDLTILIIEDESMIRKSIRSFLLKTGASVWDAPEGVKGLSIFQQFSSQFSLVILDINMPEMNGIQIYNKIKQLKSNQSILFITGYSEYEIPSPDEYDFGVLFKPFDLVELGSFIMRKRKLIKNMDS